jgi:ABC transport system ATP-binding/permease protein
VVIEAAVVSRGHVHVVLRAGVWVVEDQASANGLYDSFRRPVDSISVNSTVSLFLGSPKSNVLVTLRPYDGSMDDGLRGSVPRQGSFISFGTRETLRLGRAFDCDIFIGDEGVSRHHCIVRRDGSETFTVTDTSSNGTSVNGLRIQNGETTCAPNSQITIGTSSFVISSEGLAPLAAFSGSQLVSFRVGYSVGKPPKILLRDVNVCVERGEMVALLGPSGSGKSTLLRLLSARSLATSGSVSIDGSRLASRSDHIRSRIGFVPQDDLTTLHVDLTVRSSLEYAASLRLPQEISDDEKSGTVSRVIESLGLRAHVDTLVSKLSGGQRKRVSIAMEMLTRPSLLFLDEPTSGLDPGYETQVMSQLRTLADGGCTVVVVTHATESIDLCDRVVMLAEGRVVFDGLPNDRSKTFGTDSWPRIFSELENRPERFGPTAPRKPLEVPASKFEAPRKKGLLAQSVTLLKRYSELLIADRKGLLLLFAQAPIVGLFLMLISKDGLRQMPTPNPKSLLAVLGLVLAMTYFGAANAVREIVKEAGVLERERFHGLPASSYVASKFVVLGGVAVIQGFLVTAIGTIVTGVPKGVDLPVAIAPLFDLALAVAVAGLSGMSIGLLISSLVSSQEKAMALLPVVMLIMYLLSGGPSDLSTSPVLRTISYGNPARWGLDAAASAVNLNELNGCGGVIDSGVAGGLVCPKNWTSEAANYWTPLGALILLTALFFGLSCVAIRRRGTQAMRGT